MNGKVVIGTELDTENFDAQISNIEKRLQELDEKAREPIEIDGVKVTGVTNLTDEEVNEYNELLKQRDELVAKEMELMEAERAATQELKKQEAIIQQQNSAVKEQGLNNSDNASQILRLSKELEDMVREYNAIQNADIISETSLRNADELKQDIKDTVKEIEKLGGGKIIVSGITDVSGQMGNVNKGLTNIVKKVGRWTLAIFGVRSAYMGIRQAMGVISQYEDGMTDKLNYIKYALAYTVKPIIVWIMNAVIKILQYVNYIAKAWTGRNLFKTADAFENAQKKAKGLNKELNKTTAQFDEINTVSSDKSGGGISTPNFDLTEMPEGKVPKWLQFIVDYKDTIISVLGGIAGWLVAIKFHLTGMQALGIGIALAGIVYTIMSLLEYLKDPSWENFGKIIIGIGIAIVGLGIAIGSLPLIIAGAIALILGILIKNWKKITDDYNKFKEWLLGSTDNLMNKMVDKLGGFSLIVNTIIGTVVGVIQGAIEMVFTLFDGVFTGVKQFVDGIIRMFNGDLKGGIKLAMRGIGNIIIGVFNFIINAFNTFISPMRALIVAAGKITGSKWTMKNIRIPNIKKLAKGGIINMPGRGVPIGYGQAIGGEHGAEGVIPFTDSQQMQLLGETIGKYVKINNVIDVNMDSRRINRVLQSSNDRVNFASNKKVA